MENENAKWMDFVGGENTSFMSAPLCGDRVLNSIAELNSFHCVFERIPSMDVKFRIALDEGLISPIFAFK